MSFCSPPDTALSNAGLDQADGLRRMFAPRSVAVLPIIAPAGDQGALSANLAIAYARSGREVVVVDSTRGEVSRALGLRTRYELAHVVSGDKQLHEIVLNSASGVRIVPAARALAGAANIDQWLSALAGELDPHPDLIVLHQSTPLFNFEGDVLVVATPVAEAVTRTFAELKRMQVRGGRVRLIVSGAQDEVTARALHRALNDAARRFIGAAIDWAGFIPSTPQSQHTDVDAFTHLVAAQDSWELPRVLSNRTAH